MLESKQRPIMQSIRKSGGVAVLAAALLACSGAHRDKYLAKGNQAYQREQYGEASINYRKALQSDPNFGEAYYRLGMAEGKLGHIQESIVALSRATGLMPENDDARALLGRLYLMRYQTDRDAPAYQKVNEICDRLLERNARSFEAYRLKGYLAIADEKPDQALDFFIRANRIRPLVPDVAITLTQTLFVEGRTAEAVELGRSLMTAHPDAGPIYDTLYRHYVSAGDLAEAERILIAKVKNTPADAFPVKQLAEHYWRHNQRAQAGNTIHSLLGNPKAFPQAYLMIGEFYQALGEQDEAVRAFEAGAGAHPDEKAIYEQRAIDSLILSGKRDQGLQRINQALADGVAGGTADQLKSTRAGLLLESPLESDHTLAVHDLEALVRKTPHYAPWHFQLGQAYAAGRDLSAAQYKQARHEWETVVRLDPAHMKAWLALADLALRALDFEDCRRYAEEALARVPSLESARLLRARALLGLGRFDEARMEYDKLVRENPGRQVSLQYALLDVAEGRYSAAEKALRANYDPAHQRSVPACGQWRCNHLAYQGGQLASYCEHGRQSAVVEPVSYYERCANRGKLQSYASRHPGIPGSRAGSRTEFLCSTRGRFGSTVMGSAPEAPGCLKNASCYNRKTICVPPPRRSYESSYLVWRAWHPASRSKRHRS